ncbi:hypothetical protein QYE76_036985 [Lolium multiflorum]|uniref:C2H2-type domain-containing protein n=1 Tax=Lolium multiflorum TaxID=4521 RepID=A0AAD8R2Z7_LOLMU|nr:hypothetical protein QYE76_036985 [Lolium multiflorum]
MLTGSTSQLLLMSAASVHYLLAGGSGGGDDPNRYPWAMKSLHELDAVVPSIARGRKRQAAELDELSGFPFRCPICKLPFETEKGVRCHMRIHWKRGGMPPVENLPVDGQRYRYVCDRCREPFDTKQGLGGHRASHSGKKGCSWLEKQELAEAAAAEEARRPVMLGIDLNEPAPEAAVEEQEE